jgi:hypothetical protein
MLQLAGKERQGGEVLGGPLRGKESLTAEAAEEFAEFAR